MLCTYCGEGFTTSTRARQHEVKVHLEDNERGTGKGRERAKGARPARKCPLCEATFMHTENFKKHMVAIHSPDAPRQFVCHVCGMGFKLRGNLKHHERVSSEWA